MTWEINVRLPKESNQVGSISATWTDETLGVFPYSRPCRATQDAADAFIAEVIAARDEWKADHAANSAKSAWVLGRINTADPEVT